MTFVRVRFTRFIGETLAPYTECLFDRRFLNIPNTESIYFSNCLPLRIQRN
jgi:hypothetical protein